MKGVFTIPKGVVIYAFRKAAYGKMAFNLAVSIKANSPDIPVCLIHDDDALAHLRPDQLKYFNIRKPIDPEDLFDGQRFTPGKAKILGYKYFPFERNMIIDADSVCINTLEPLFEKCENKSVYSQTVGTWEQDAEHWTCQWMALKVAKGVFDLPDKYRLFEINSSFMYVRKGKEAEKLYDQAYRNYEKGVDHPGVSKIWGGTFPDELAFNIAFAQTGIAPNFDDLELDKISNLNPKPIFFSTSEAYKPSKHGDGFYFLGCYGGRNFTSKSLQAQCDTYMRGYCSKFGFSHEWKYHLLMMNKHISKR